MLESAKRQRDRCVHRPETGTQDPRVLENKQAVSVGGNLHL